MLGLPPTIEEVNSFKGDHDPRAWERLVDRMLESPRYGERWAQHWLDVIRYADTHGFEVNTPRDNAWPYRDYVIRAFNEDKPYDQFISEQLAGDTLHADEATGFLVAAAVLLPGQIGKDDESKRLARQDELDEIIQGTGATLLGLTIGCARCHDHKFDPITQRDYYAMQAFFAGVEYGDRTIDDPGREQRLAEAADLATRIGGLEQLKAKKKELEATGMVFGGTFRKPDTTFVLRRGDPEQRLEEIGAAIPILFTRVVEGQGSNVAEVAKTSGGLEPAPELLASSATVGSDEQRRRLALAKWIASPDNPLTARVMVNRIWMYHFGQGLVATPSDFGLNGARPSHPELLDWLAGEFIRGGWSIKHMHRLILTSKTYRQSHHIDPRATQLDRDNRWLWRFASRRLEGEAIRDSMLAASGELNLKMGGPGFDFFKSRGGLSGFPPVDQFGSEQLRRMIYAHKIRMEPVPVFGAFDCPDAGQATPIRGQSTTAIQALNLFNSQFVVERAEKFANRVRAAAAGDMDREVAVAFELAVGRQPMEIERRASLDVVNNQGLATLCRVLFNSNEFLFIP
ncbi:MAG: DUF1553 domain-containing protein [Planctomycetia bacterium]|nr:DUF1553 domain-containing protein [Planctomycetia bacterium]